MYMEVIKVETDNDVKTFNKKIPKHGTVMVGFFMTHCPACIAFKPEWEKFVAHHKVHGKGDAMIAEVDSNQAANVDFDTSKLDGFPTVLVKNNDEVDVIKVRITKKFRAIKYQIVKQVLDGSLGRWAVVSGRYEGYTPIGDHTGPWTYITPYDDVVLTKHISPAKTVKLAVATGLVGGRRRRTRKKRGGDKWESARKQEKKKYCKKKPH